MTKPTLFSYWRSSCSWRVRMALEFYGIDYDYKAVNLLKGEQKSQEYEMETGNVAAQVPSLRLEDGFVLTQSMAIVEYLEEKYGKDGSRLFGNDAKERALIRQLSLEIVANTQPLQNLAVLKKVMADFGEDQKVPWGAFWIENGLKVLEKLLEKSSSKYSVGDNLSFVDCCLIPQIYNARRFQVDLTPFPTILKIEKNVQSLPLYKKAHPDSQPDAQ